MQEQEPALTKVGDALETLVKLRDELVTLGVKLRDELDTLNGGNNKMFKKTEIRLSGSGGQGLILAGIVLANAAVLDKKPVTQTQSYGPESRGGASRADVIISNDVIYFPEATRFDVLLALTQEACDKFLFDLKDDGLLFVDNSLVKNISLVSSTVFELPFTEIALKRLGSALPTNILSLSFMVKKTGVVSDKALKGAIENTVKKSFVELNLKAMKLGFELTKKY